MRRITKKLNEDKKILSVYFTAGYPNLNDTVAVIRRLEKNGVDMIQIGLPYSDPFADGPTVQKSSAYALQNGMSTVLLFHQLENIRNTISVPLIIMGYFNAILHFGVENFCRNCSSTGIDGLIIPDLPIEIYTELYKPIFDKYRLAMIFLITPETSEERIRHIDKFSNAFIYMVSSASTRANDPDIDLQQQHYVSRIASMNLKNPLIVGFGISDKAAFEQATTFAKGAIIKSSFIKTLTKNGVSGFSDFIEAFAS